MSVSIYSPRVKREAAAFGITELQAWRKLNAREAILRNQRSPERRRGSRVL